MSDGACYQEMIAEDHRKQVEETERENAHRWGFGNQCIAVGVGRVLYRAVMGNIAANAAATPTEQQAAALRKRERAIIRKQHPDLTLPWHGVGVWHPETHTLRLTLGNGSGTWHLRMGWSGLREVWWSARVTGGDGETVTSPRYATVVEAEAWAVGVVASREVA